MRHAVVGAGAVGLAIAVPLAAAGEDVELVMRPASLAKYQGTVTPLRLRALTISAIASGLV